MHFFLRSVPCDFPPNLCTLNGKNINVYERIVNNDSLENVVVIPESWRQRFNKTYSKDFVFEFHLYIFFSHQLFMFDSYPNCRVARFFFRMTFGSVYSLVIPAISSNCNSLSYPIVRLYVFARLDLSLHKASCETTAAVHFVITNFSFRTFIIFGTMVRLISDVFMH